MILDCEVEVKALVLFGKPILSNGQVLTKIDLEEITFNLNDKQIGFDLCIIAQNLDDIRVVTVINVVDDDVVVGHVPVKKRLGVDVLSEMIMNFKSDRIEKYD